MGLFDDYFDPEQFQDSGGLLGRLLSLRPQYRPDADNDAQASTLSAPASPGVAPVLPTPDYGQTQNIAIGNYQIPQFGSADVATLSQSAPSPDLGDRLSAGLQSWGHTPVGNPFAALANGIAGFNSGQRADEAGVTQQSTQTGANDPVASPNLNARYQALRPVLGDRNAMLAIVHPEIGRTLIAQALVGRTRSGNTNAGSGGG